MQMQLDLDETEACHFENMANGLLEKIGRITEERDGLQILFEQVQREREGLLASIEELKMESLIKDEEVQRASDLLDDMQDKIAERDLIIQRIKVSACVIVIMLSLGTDVVSVQRPKRNMMGIEIVCHYEDTERQEIRVKGRTG